ncbi:MAG TPA: AAA family ATPase [Steroidobacteraceae bacterium]|nr:AAA family ATPase [Steroidobacteraceae bacterium]
MTTVSTSPDARRELEALLRSRVPLVVIETRDEPRALELLASLSPRLAAAHTPVFQWTVTDGLRRLDIDLGGAQQHNAEPAAVLRSVRASAVAGIYILLDFHPFLADPINVRLLKDICQDYGRTPRTMVLISHEVALPRELEHLAARFRLAFPDRAERRGIIEKVAAEWSRTRGDKGGAKVRTDRKSLELLIENLAGLSVGDTERLARKAILDDGALLPSDLPAVMKAKYELLNRGGVLSFEYDTAQFADLGGMAHLKEWLKLRRPAFDGSAPELEAPKGVLLLGVQGCGKSVAARAAAGIYGVPLLRLDFGAIHNKYIGESERNLRETLETAGVMAPCVLWIDEIEKSLATGDGDSGTSRRLLGAFLTWLAERKQKVFVVATANDIAALPPELIRKGRFDEIFFVDLPDQQVRADILRIHAAKRSLQLADPEVARLASLCDGFSGAEIEQAVVSAVYAAHDGGRTVGALDIQREIEATRPLSVVMAERVAELRAWAAERTVAAN